MDTSTFIAVSTFVLTLFIQIFSAGACIGGLIMAVKFLQSEIKRLEKKQDESNKLKERMVAVEQSTKSAHHRLDELTEHHNF